MKNLHPPRTAEWLVRKIGGCEGEMLAFDMADLYAIRADASAWRAWSWYWLHTAFLAGTRLRHPWDFAPRVLKQFPSYPDGSRSYPKQSLETMISIFQDLRFAVRSFRRAPMTIVLALVTLALGIGANTAFFSVLQGVVLQPLPFPEPDRLMSVTIGRALGTERTTLLANSAKTFQASIPYSSVQFTLLGDGPPTIISGARIGVEMDAVFRTPPILGRSFNAADARLGSEPVVILSYALWQSRFGGDKQVVGRSVQMEGYSASERTVIGVMPATFTPFSWEAAAYAPVIVDPSLLDWNHRIGYRLLARVVPGVTPTQVHSEISTIVAGASEGETAVFMTDAVDNIVVEPYQAALTGVVAGPLRVLLGAVGLILLMACVNVANLLLARAGGRQREIATRIALGAPRRRMVRQLMSESLLLAIVGGILGVATAYVSLEALVAVLPSEVPRTENIVINGKVLLFSLAATLGAGLLFGTLPALQTTKGVGLSLVHGAGGTSNRGSRRLSHGLMAAEVALAVVLVAGTGLFARSLWNLYSVDPGFTVERLQTFRVKLSDLAYPAPEQRRSFVQRVTEELSAVSGVQTVGVINLLPMTQGDIGVGISLTGETSRANENPGYVSFRTITPGFVDAMGIRLVDGRDFTSFDQAESPAVGLINERLADRLWPGESAVGKEVLFGDASPWFTVVGVMANVSQLLDADSRIQVYLPYAQSEHNSSLYFAVRSSGDTPIFAVARERVWGVDPNVPITDEATMLELVSASVATPRFYLILFTALGGLALLLGVVGLYGVMAATVSQRTRDIGIRLALGANRRNVIIETMRLGLTWTAVGVVAGLFGALAAGRMINNLLFNVAPTDVSVLAGVSVVLVAVASVAIYATARRAAGVDPMVSLRTD